MHQASLGQKKVLYEDLEQMYGKEVDLTEVSETNFQELESSNQTINYKNESITFGSVRKLFETLLFL